MPISSRTANAVNATLLEWYGLHGRELPWRATREPYHILMSEIMLQQTQVERVVPAYHRFLSAFPTIQDLAAASRMEVIQAWQGLGYYRRAVRLHNLSKIVVIEMDGEIPHSYDELIKLPGIGQYTAAAVACFAFNQQIPTIDVNVSRVLHRVHGKPRTSNSSSPNRAFYHLAKQSLPQGYAIQWNQALMDVGAIFCKNQAPSCDSCPLSKTCSNASVISQSLSSKKKPPKAPAIEQFHTPFKGSTRYFRGNIIRILSLLDAREKIAPEELLDAINVEVNTDHKLDWRKFLDLLRTMAEEGLISEIQDQTTCELLALKLPS